MNIRSKRFRPTWRVRTLTVARASAALAFGVLLSTSAHAVEKHWNVGTGLWGLQSNWSPAGVPQPSDLVYVDRAGGGTAVVNLSMGSPNSVSVLNGNAVRIANNGSLGAGGDFIVGTQRTGGTLNILNPNPVQAFTARVTVGNAMRVGMYSGAGSINQNAGIVTVNQLLRVGDRQDPGVSFPAIGLYNLSEIGVLNAARLEVGYGGNSGEFGAIQGVFNLTGNAVLNVATGAQIPDPKIGGGGASGTFNQAGGTFFSPHRIIDIAPNGGSGAYNYSGGTFTVPGINLNNPNATFNYHAGDYLYLNQVSITRGRINLTPGGGDKVAHARLLWSSSSNWTIDVGDDAMIVDATLGETVQSAMFRGFNNGAWDGTGIRSSAAAAANSGGTLTRSLGFAVASDVGITALNGHPVNPTSTVIKYTVMGDANLDGIVNLADFNRLASNFGLADKAWSQGDFNYDTVVSLHDFNLLAGNFGVSASGASVTPEDWAALAAAIPEPHSLLAFGIALSAGTLRRRVRR